MLTAPQALPRREEIEAFVHESSTFLNEVIRPIESTRATHRGEHDARLQDLRREILAKHREKVQRARQSYEVLLSSVEEADVVLEALDARDPTACRLLEAEGSCLGKRPLILVLNKIELVPQDAVVRWIAFLRETFSKRSRRTNL
jgi:ribosome biogenesis GTPase A